MLGNSLNLGRLFENLIYLDLRRHGFEIYYFMTRSGKEIDFVAKSQSRRILLIRACYDIQDEKTFQREVSALKEAESELEHSESFIVTAESYLSFLSALGLNF